MDLLFTIDELIQSAESELVRISSLLRSTESMLATATSSARKAEQLEMALDDNYLSLSVRGCGSIFPLESIRNIREFLATPRIEEMPVRQVLDTEVLPQLIQVLLNNENVAFLCFGFVRRCVDRYFDEIAQILFWFIFDFEVSLEIMRTLSLLTRGGSDREMEYMVECGTIKSLMGSFALSSSTNTKQLALDGLSNVMRRNDKYKALALNENFLEYTHELLQCMAINSLHDGHPDLLRLIASSIYALFDGDGFNLNRDQSEPVGGLEGGGRRYERNKAPKTTFVGTRHFGRNAFVDRGRQK